jgi:DNA-binding XRE family transcriptional regulator
MSKIGTKRQEKRHCVTINIQLCAGTHYGLQGEIIRLLRLTRKLSQKKLAEELGISRTRLIEIEKRGLNDGVMLFKLAEILGVDVDVFNPVQ